MRTETAGRLSPNVASPIIGLAFALLWTLSASAWARQAGTATPSTPEMRWNRDLLGSGRIEQLASPMAQASKAAQASVDDSVMGRIKRSLPSLDRLGDSLKYGNVVVVSSQGPEVVALIRAVPMRKGQERRNVLAKLLEFSRQAVPEAQNFIGFVYEYGLFGAPRNLSLAREYYTAAAAHRYQPALLNLTTMAYFGKGQSSNAEVARELIHQAVAIGPESSGRVCGLASFIEYRHGDPQAALRLGRFCYSALAHVPNAAYDTQLPLAQRIKMLRDSIGSGAPDGYHWLETITQRAGPDPNYLYCKYRLINEVRENPAQADLNTLARTCYANSTGEPGDKASETTIKGIVSFVVTEGRALEHLRQAKRFHHSWSVPYLPFSQNDVDLFESILKEVE